MNHEAPYISIFVASVWLFFSALLVGPKRFWASHISHRQEHGHFVAFLQWAGSDGIVQFPARLGCGGTTMKMDLK